MRISAFIIALTVTGAIAFGAEASSTEATPPPADRPSKDPPLSGWESTYRDRSQWWSLQPVKSPTVPAVRNENWPRNEVDRYILAALERQELSPSPEADRRTLARRLCFGLTGLSPEPELVEQFVTNADPDAYGQLVLTLLASPHFGERWARHWMDVVHYADTHGYEWDTPAKNAWRYRDYLIRAFNSDLPINRFLQEQIAGDLIAPRIDPSTGLNESLVGPMAMRLGERRHGDNAAAEGVTQEAMANIIDTVGKGFLGTTIACAQCHDHKLDAVAQKDYYALTGVLMSTRWTVRCLDVVDPNLAVIDELQTLKQEVRRQLGKVWLKSRDRLQGRIQDLPSINTNKAAATAFPETLLAFWQRANGSPVTREEFNKERDRRVAENRANLKLLADFSNEHGAAGWRWDGFGMRHGLARDGELVVADDGDIFLPHLLPAGRWSHRWSMRLAGAVSSPLFDPQSPLLSFSIGYAAGKYAAESIVVDHALHSERMKFLDQPSTGWLTLKAGGFDTLEGGIDQGRRRAYVELVTKSLNNYFPPRTGYGGVSEKEAADESSWLGVTRIYQHPAGKPPLDELARFAPLFPNGPVGVVDRDWPDRLARLVYAAVERWSVDDCDEECVRLLNDAISAKLLPNTVVGNPELAEAVGNFRAAQRKLRTDQTVGSVADWAEGGDERLAKRGSYTEFGEEVQRGTARFLAANSPQECATASGRLELAHSIANDRNPLTARVFVNRVWLYLFGEGIVRTPDDFGHLGQTPTHPELLDYLAAQFVADGWSLKRLITRLVTSAAWRQSNLGSPDALMLDPENRLWHHRPMRRLEAEAIRDALLVVARRFDPSLYGPPINPYRMAEDPSKRLFSGPLDGNGRRSIYVNMTLMEPPRFLALFNQPIPKLTIGRRDVTSVPDQALALLNDPFVVAMAKHWSERVLRDNATSPEPRVVRMFTAAFARPPGVDETARLVALAKSMARLRGADAHMLMGCQPAWQDVAHALINLKEFIYVP